MLKYTNNYAIWFGHFEDVGSRTQWPQFYGPPSTCVCVHAYAVNGSYNWSWWDLYLEWLVQSVAVMDVHCFSATHRVTLPCPDCRIHTGSHVTSPAGPVMWNNRINQTPVQTNPTSSLDKKDRQPFNDLFSRTTWVGQHQKRLNQSGFCISSVSFDRIESIFLKYTGDTDTTRMWANAQRDGRPAKYRWRPMFNAAKFGWWPLLDCRAVTHWNLHGCLKLASRSQPLEGRSSLYYTTM